MNKMSYTSPEVKNRWIKANYRQYTVNLRYDNDQDLIDYIEQHKEQFGTTEIFRVALQLLIDRGGI